MMAKLSLFWIEILFNNVKIFTVNFDQFHVSLLNKSINLF